VKSDAYAKIFPAAQGRLTGYFSDLRNTMAARGKIGPFFSQLTVVADLTAHWMANVSTKLLTLVDRGVWTFDELIEACPLLPKRPTDLRSDNCIYVYMGKSIMQNVFNLIYSSLPRSWQLKYRYRMPAFTGGRSNTKETRTLDYNSSIASGGMASTISVS